MELYYLYFNCSQLLFLVFSHLYFIFITLDLVCMIQGMIQARKATSFFIDIIRIKFNNYKFGTICISLISFIVSFVILFSNNQFVILLGCEDIRVMPEGTYCYYVYATNENGKTYTLPAKIEKINRLQYFVENIYFKNGGYLYFSDGDYIEYEDTFTSWDQNENDWEIELTNKKVYHEKVAETNPFKPHNLILPFIEVFTISIATVIYVFKLVKIQRKLL